MAARSEPRDDSGYDLTRVTAYRLAVLSNRLTLWSARVYRREFGTSVLEWRVLSILAVLGPAMARDVAEFSVLDKSNVSRAVGRLTARGLVRQTSHPEDGRSRILTLTGEGKALHRRIGARSRERQEALFEGFSAAEREQLAALLDRLDARARALLAATDE
ncbi:MAG: MarR family transcriptional regulator [Defluviicoccus sp.]|nr:MarR family transcriptional regulator [Defluviicoccus sp.]MDE0382509.1 MarR family transcriptional regulator [Defluviicoccus sp.]